MILLGTRPLRAQEWIDLLQDKSIFQECNHKKWAALQYNIITYYELRCCIKKKVTRGKNPKQAKIKHY